DEHVELLERVLVQKQRDALARRELAAPMLCLDALFPAAHARHRPPLLQLLENVLHAEKPLLRRTHPTHTASQQGNQADDFRVIFQADRARRASWPTTKTRPRVPWSKRTSAR